MNVGLQRLEAFVGDWATAGEMQGRPFTARDTYEWLAGRHFLVHRFDAAMPEGRVTGIEIIGYDAETGLYPMQSFDSTGQASTLLGRSDEGVWTFTGEQLRFTGRFRADGRVFGGVWEHLYNDSWVDLMTVQLTKIS